MNTKIESIDRLPRAVLEELATRALQTLVDIAENNWMADPEMWTAMPAPGAVAEDYIRKRLDEFLLCKDMLPKREPVEDLLLVCPHCFLIFPPGDAIREETK
jgi:hypothetical protein